MKFEDLWAPGLLDEEREHRVRWAGAHRSERRGTGGSETGFWPVEAEPDPYVTCEACDGPYTGRPMTEDDVVGPFCNDCSGDPLKPRKAR